MLDKNMTLEEKLAIIDSLIERAQIKQKEINPDIPVDPAELLMCEGCQ